jgi:hypothetical protein
MSRCLPIAGVAAATLALSASALAGPPQRACSKPFHAAPGACRIIAAGQAFESFVRDHLTLPPPTEGQNRFCSLKAHHPYRVHCKLQPTGKDAPPGCAVSGIVVEVKRRVYRFRSIEVTRSCPKWKGSK